MTEPDVHQQVSDVAAEEWSKVVAILASETGDVALAEEVAQDAFATALEKWPTSGIPQRPGAWLLVIARRRAIDRIRREVSGREKSALVASLEQRTSPALLAIELSLVRDEQLQLLFACCHPALSVEAQLALTLRCVAGVKTEHLGRAFLTSGKTMAQRLVRAKKKIKAAGIPLRMPTDGELVDRLRVVHHVIYLLYNNGYLPPGGSALYDESFTVEAIRLARLVVRLMPDDAESAGLLALLLLTEARRAARLSTEGELVLLEDQDRTLWNQEYIEQGHAHLEAALRLPGNGQFQILAAISSLHADAQTPADTDWKQIELLYRSLLCHADTPVTRLNHAVAVALAVGPTAGLLKLEPLEEQLSNYHYFFGAKAQFLALAERPVEARKAFETGLALTKNNIERRFYERKLEELA